MISPIDYEQADWFRSWIETDKTLPPEHFDRYVVLLHPGTYMLDHGSPFSSPNLNPTSDDPLHDRQMEKVDQLLLETYNPETECHFALYAGFINHKKTTRWGGREPNPTWHIGRLNYLLFSGLLQESNFGGVVKHWGESYIGFQQLSYLWPTDHSWFLSSTPDTAVTLIGCDDPLAQKLLKEPMLYPQEWNRNKY